VEPDTRRDPDGVAATVNTAITGFSLTHGPGPGCARPGTSRYCDTGAVPTNPDSASAAFSHSSESAHPGSYAVTAGGAHAARVTQRTGVRPQFSYPDEPRRRSCW